jgi:aminoglycoside phosphotransferase (APT) family kinase protein
LIAEYIEGETVFDPPSLSDFLSALAQHLAKIHAVTPAAYHLSFLRSQEELYASKLAHRPAVPDDSLDESRIRDALQAVWPRPGANASVLLHGDYWPGNTLWRGGHLVGVIDWEDAHLGDPLEDLGNSRLEILWAFGEAAMHSFTRQYCSQVTLDLANLPYWDLWAALRPANRLSEWASDSASERDMREKHRLFVNRAFEMLA